MPIFDGVQGSILAQLLQAIVPSSMGTPDEQLMNALGMNQSGYPNQPMQPGQPPQPYAQPGQPPQPGQPAQPAQVPQGGGQSYPVPPPSASAGRDPGPFSWGAYPPAGMEPESAVSPSSFVNHGAPPAAPRSVVTGRPAGPMYQSAPQPQPIQQLPAEAIAQPGAPPYPQSQGPEMPFEYALARANQAAAERLTPGGLSPLSSPPPPPELQFDRYGTMANREWQPPMQPGISRIPPAVQQAVNTAPQPGRSKRELVLGLINMLSQAQQGIHYGASRMNPIWDAQQRQEQDWQLRVENDKIRKENERYDRAQREWESDPARQVAKLELMSRAQRDIQEDLALRQRRQRLNEGTRRGYTGSTLDYWMDHGQAPAPQQFNTPAEVEAYALSKGLQTGDMSMAEYLRNRRVQDAKDTQRPFAPPTPTKVRREGGQVGWATPGKQDWTPILDAKGKPVTEHETSESTGTWQDSVNDQGLVFRENNKTGEMKIKIDPTTGKQMKRKLPGTETSNILNDAEEGQVKEGVHNQIMAEFSEKYPGFLFMGGSQGGPQSHQAEYYKRYKELYPQAYQDLLDRKNPAAKQQGESDAMEVWLENHRRALQAIKGNPTASTTTTTTRGAPSPTTSTTLPAAPQSAAPAKPESGIWDKTKSIATDAMDRVLQGISGVRQWNEDNQRRAEELSQEMQRRRAEQK